MIPDLNEILSVAQGLLQKILPFIKGKTQHMSYELALPIAARTSVQIKEKLYAAYGRKISDEIIGVKYKANLLDLLNSNEWWNGANKEPYIRFLSTQIVTPQTEGFIQQVLQAHMTWVLLNIPSDNIAEFKRAMEVQLTSSTLYNAIISSGQDLTKFSGKTGGQTGLDDSNTPNISGFFEKYWMYILIGLVIIGVIYYASK